MPEEEEENTLANITKIVTRIDKCLMGTYENPGGLIGKVEDNTRVCEDNKDKISKFTTKAVAAIGTITVALIGAVIALLK